MGYTRSMLKPLVATLAALIVLSVGLYALVGCGAESVYNQRPAKGPEEHPPGSMLIDVDKNLTITFCDHGNRVYRVSGGGQAVAVVPNDPSCAEPGR